MLDLAAYLGLGHRAPCLWCHSSSPLTPQGSSWLHVGTDQPFASVSIGACYQVWAVARDGSAFYRGSVSPSKPAGECCPPGGPQGPQAVMGAIRVRF